MTFLEFLREDAFGYRTGGEMTTYAFDDYCRMTGDELKQTWFEWEAEGLGLTTVAIICSENHPGVLVWIETEFDYFCVFPSWEVFKRMIPHIRNPKWGPVF